MRIAITNNIPAAVETLTRAVLSVPKYELAWIAENGEQAVKQAKNDVPDLILMDVLLPMMDGIEATRQIMLHSPCAILVVTASVDSISGKVFDAMGVGAVDAVNTPLFSIKQDNDACCDLLKKIAMIETLIVPSSNSKDYTTNNRQQNQIITSQDKLVVIGASTGGPSALAKILAAIPKDFSAPIVVVQHVDSNFINGFRQWLDGQIILPVLLIKDGDKLKSGSVQLADSGKHIIINKYGQLLYQNEPQNYVNKPSINVLFESVAANWDGQAIGVLLTGMGKDGAAGLLAMRNHGQCTIAQDKESCAVYGMPKAAVEMDAAQDIKPLTEIATTLCLHYTFNKKSQAVINE